MFHDYIEVEKNRGLTWTASSTTVTYHPREVVQQHKILGVVLRSIREGGVNPMGSN